MPIYNADFPSDLLASTLVLIEPKLHDAVTNHIALLKNLVSKGFKRTLDGEPFITHRVRLGSHQVSSYAGADEVQLQTAQTRTVAKYPWKQLWGYAAITGIDKAKNSGSEARVVNMYAEEIEGVMQDFRTEIEAQLFGDGTGNNDKDIDGLGLLIDDDGSYSEVGGIDSNTYTGWRNYYRTASSGSFAAIGESYMQTAVNTCERESDGSKVDLIVTTQAIKEAYVNAGVRLQQVRSENKSMLDLGFRNVEYMGIPIVWSDQVTAGQMYFLTTSSFYWNVMSGFDMKPLDITRPANQDVESQLIILYCNPSCGNRKRNGTIVSFATP